MSDFEIGATVRLKSGGPVMTVSSKLSEKGSYNCVWFASDSEIKSQYFLAGTLKAAEALA